MCALKIEPLLSENIEELAGQSLSVCYQCGTCTAACPLGVHVRKLVRQMQLGAKEDAVSDNTLWSCATCKLCELRCPRGVNITDLLHALRILGFQGRKAPAKLEQALWGVYEEGNPWKGKKLERGKWAEGLGLKVVGNTSDRPSKVLLYAGCAVSYDPRLQNVARSLAEILKDNADVAILGEKESCCGDVVYQIGEDAYFEELVQNNIKTFKDSGADTLITVSPHCFNMFKTVYPNYGSMPNVVHYTEFLSNLLDKDALKPNGGNSSGEKTVTTYHDPCYLGRYYGIYEEPRKILESIPNIELTEMSDTKENALCCGGGGGQMWTDHDGASPSHERVVQASETKASVMATSCPYCIQNFEDATKTKGLELKVMDVSEILNQSLKKK